MKKNLFTRFSKIPIYIKYIFSNDIKKINKIIKNNNFNQSFKKNDYLDEFKPKFEYLYRSEYTSIKGLTSHSYKYYGLSK